MNSIYRVSVIGSYMITAIAMVLLNKTILKSYPKPLTNIWIQALTGACCLYVASWMNLLKINTVNWREGCLQRSDNRLLFSINFLSIIFSTFCLKRVDASSFQVFARSMNTPVAAIIQCMWLRDKLSWLTILSCSIVTSGFLSGVLYDKEEVDFLGASWGMVAASISAFHVVLIKWLSLKEAKSEFKLTFSDVDRLFYMNAAYTAIGLPISLLEFSPLQIASATNCLLRMDGTFMKLMGSFFMNNFLVGALGIFFNLLVFMQVGLTSPTSHMISSAIRGVIQLYVLSSFFGESVSQGKMLATCLVVFGGLMYTLSRRWDL